jgi:hypothetical protein
MIIDNTFAAAYVDNNIRHRIFGRRLLPFSMWHLLLMQVLESPFVKEGDVSLHDLKNAISICTLRYRNSKIRRPFLPLFLKQKPLEKAVKRFLNYLGDYISKPEYTIVPWSIKEEDQLRPTLPVTDAPQVIVKVFQAAHALRMPVNEVWDIPIGEVYVADAMYLRSQGSRLNFMDPEEREFQAAMAAAEKAKQDAA